MISHEISVTVASCGTGGSLRFQRGVAARFQGPGIDTGVVSCGAEPRRLRGTLLLSGARPAGARRGRECADGGDRDADRTAAALLRGARTACSRALRHQRDTEG